MLLYSLCGVFNGIIALLQKEYILYCIYNICVLLNSADGNKFTVDMEGDIMIELTKLNDMKFSVNAEIIEFIEETPDTVISLTTGKKIIVKESRQEVMDLVIAYKRAIFATFVKFE